MRSVAFMVMAVLVACGPSAAEIKTAKSAGYSGEPAQLFAEIEAVTTETYKLGEVDREGFALATMPQWYSPEGGRQGGTGDYVNIGDRSVQLMLIVQLVAADSRYVVTVIPKTLQHLSGSPRPRELLPDDPNLPGWVHGRVDSLHMEIHKRLQKYAVQ
jgi:hypothetical protein